VAMESLSGPFKFKPGQFVLIKFRSNNIITQLHPFTISSSNSADDLRLSIKSSGDYTATVGKLEAGAIAEVEGPYGGFTEKLSDAHRNIWIAGGIGITPFLSMARSFTESKPDAKPTLLIHSVVTPDQAIFANELMSTSEKFNWFSFKPYVTKNEGFLTAEKVAALSGGLEGADIFLCGPPAMMNSLIQQFKALGISMGRIHREEFKLLR
jgi:predicted ferric reductase